LVVDADEHGDDQLVVEPASPSDVLERVAGGYAFRAARDAAEACARLVERPVQRALSQAALETLAIVAYLGPCTRPDCHHRTPVFRSPVVAEKELGVKYMELTCKSCKLVFHAELGSARMAPGAERVVLNNEFPFTELSEPFAKLLHEYEQGRKADKDRRIVELAGMAEAEPGLHCPKCGAFAGQLVRDVLKRHQSASLLVSPRASIERAARGVRRVLPEPVAP